MYVNRNRNSETTEKVSRTVVSLVFITAANCSLFVSVYVLRDCVVNGDTGVSWSCCQRHPPSSPISHLRQHRPITCLYLDQQASGVVHARARAPTHIYVDDRVVLRAYPFVSTPDRRRQIH